MRADARYKVFGDSSNTQYGTTDLDRNLNKGFHAFISLALGASGVWQVRGTYATANLVANVKKYPFPSDWLRIDRVEVKLKSDGDYQQAFPIDLTEPDVNLNDFEPATPRYDIRNQKIIIYCGSIETVTSGLKIWIEKEATELSATTDEPNIPEFGFEFLTSYAEMLYYKAQKMFNEYNNVLIELMGPSKDGTGGLSKRITNYYIGRTGTQRNKIASQLSKFSFK